MSGVRAPRFAGVTGGLGTSTLAAALHGVDTGRYAGGPVDVLVCGVDSLSTAARLGGPVLAVVADRAPRLDRFTAGFGAVVTIPEIGAWRELEAPDVAGLLGMAPQRRPARMRPYIEALLEVTAALLRSGVLEQPARPVRPSLTPAVMARVAPVPVRPVVVVGPQRLPVRVVPAPVVPTPVVRVAGGARALAPAGTGPASGGPGVAGRPLWRGLQAVERVPVLPSAAAPTPVPVRRTEPAATTAGLDDDAVESQRVG
ncbi:MAG: hypothetical protein L0I24_23440 [Pseudonocardia sp.]|nr:hypothetical protein [Pseudonocardia sp.]